MKKTHLVSILLAMLSLTACKTTTATTFSQSYRNPGYGETVFKKMMVIGVAQNQEARKAFEDALVSAITKEGGAAQSSIEIVPHEAQMTEEELHAALEGGGFDGVLITHLLSVDKSKDYVPPKRHLSMKTQYYPGASAWGYGYGGYYGFYGTTFAMVHEPGYFDTSTTVTLETSLYSYATNELVWTGQSETIDPDSIEDVRASVTQAVAQKLKAERLIP
jgi:hypothetical protein